tara:strand:+ start:1040 stop:1408 length:369 start_codon:yes stop_codon:yes gene_type:complete
MTALTTLIEKKTEITAQIKTLNDQLGELKTEQQQLDYDIMDKLDANGLDRIANSSASVSINESTVGEVTDWDAFTGHVGKQQAFELMQKRVSNLALNELWKMGEHIPGVQPRTVRRINFRKL